MYTLRSATCSGGCLHLSSYNLTWTPAYNFWYKSCRPHQPGSHRQDDGHTCTVPGTVQDLFSFFFHLPSHCCMASSFCLGRRVGRALSFVDLRVSSVAKILGKGMFSTRYYMRINHVSPPGFDLGVTRYRGFPLNHRGDRVQHYISQIALFRCGVFVGV